MKINILLITIVSACWATDLEAQPGAGKRTGADAGQGWGRGQGRGRAGGWRHRRGWERENQPISGPACLRGLSVNTGATNSLSRADRDGLIRLREEEQLAHDVYAAFSETWPPRIFQNISEAETRHVEAVGYLLEQYKVRDPLANRRSGHFRDAQLQTFYDEAIKRGESSLIEAFKVGAEIEEMDIADLQKCISATREESIKQVFGNLMRASRNHLRAFMWQIDRQGGQYHPRHLPRDEFDAIASSSHERGPHGG